MTPRTNPPSPSSSKIQASAHCELLIVGGGIHGTSLARMASANQIQTILVEKGDFGQGASSASSKLIHGGLRYLENYDFSLVYEAAHEREIQAKTAPHLVKDADFLFPITPNTRYPKWMVGLGIQTYEFLAGKHLLHKHHFFNKSELLKQEPDLHLHNGAFGYSDAVGDDIRMVIENAKDAAQMGAQMWNYHRALKIKQEPEGVYVQIRKELTNEEFWICAQKVALNLGPNTDLQLYDWGFKSSPTHKPLTVLSQGTHLIAQKLPIKHPFILPVPKSQRYFFVVPWLGNTLIGTTEVPLTAEQSLNPITQKQEIEELHELFKHYFPELELDVICTTCGIRPLAASSSFSFFPKSKKSTIKASRKHIIHKVSDRICSLVGGKYTIHRLMAMDVLKHFKLPHTQELKNKPLPGSKHFSSLEKTVQILLEKQPLLSTQFARRWAEMYGIQSLQITPLSQNEQTQSIFKNEDEALVAEIIYTQKFEFVQTLSDFLRRRSHLYFRKDGAIPLMNLLLPHLPKWPHWDHSIQYLAELSKNNHQAL